MGSEQSAPAANANTENQPAEDIHMFTDSKDVDITDGDFETAQQIATYHSGVTPVADQQSSRGSAHMFTRSSGATIRGGNFKVARSIVTHHGPASSVTSQSVNTGDSAAVPGAQAAQEPQNAAPAGTGILGDRPASRPGIPNPKEHSSSADSREQIVYSTVATRESGSRVRR